MAIEVLRATECHRGDTRFHVAARPLLSFNLTNLTNLTNRVPAREERYFSWSGSRPRDARGELGWSYGSDLAREIGVRPAGRCWLGRMRWTRPRRLDDSRVPRLLALRWAGRSLRQIAVAVKVLRSTVARAVRRETG